MNQKLASEFNPSILSPSINHKKEGVLKAISTFRASCNATADFLSNNPFICKDRSRKNRTLTLNEGIKDYVETKNSVKAGQSLEDIELMNKGKR